MRHLVGVSRHVSRETLMGFATGVISFRRYHIVGSRPEELTPEWHAAIAAHAFGKHADVSTDGVEIGWIRPNHLFDIDFADASQIEVGRFVFVAMRLDRTAACTGRHITSRPTA